MRFLVPQTHARLAGLLAEVGLAVEVAVGLDAVQSPSGPILLASQFPLHQLRVVLRAAGVEADALTPVSPLGQRWQAILRSMEAAPMVVGAGDLDDTQAILPELEGALDLHQAMEVLLVAHRVALMDADLPRAAAALARFSAAMLAHVAVEEREVMPRYVALRPTAGWARGADPEIVANEHDKIRRRLPELAAALAEVEAAALPDPERKVACLELLDREKVFADLLEHHDLRERTHVYPHLQRALDREVCLGLALAVLDGFGER
jgi:hypothetical protein